MSGPLNGFTVLDLSRVLTGPYCSMMLADMGADVIKVERPGSGDDTRQWGPPWLGGESSYFMSINRNKRSLSLDLKSVQGREIAVRLAARADVLLENFRPGTAERLGLGYSQLKAVNPRLVYCSISGFGQDGPYRDRTAYDLIAQGMGGLMGITGIEGEQPIRVGVAVSDIGAGMFAAYGILAALLERERSREGQQVDVSLLDGQVAWMTYMAHYYFATGNNPPKRASAHPSIVPYQAFRAQDGWVNIAVGNDALWAKFAPLLGIDPADPRFVTNADRVLNRDELVDLMEKRLAEKPVGEWVSTLVSAGIPCGPVYRLDEVFSDPQVIHREMVCEVEHPTAGDVRVTGVPVKLGRTAGAIRTPPPLLGQHSDEILGELGYSREEIKRLRESGVI